MAKTTKKPKKTSAAKKAKKTSTKRREWTNEDVRQLKSLAKQKVGVVKIAKALKRTPGATTVKAHILGVSLSMRD
jgi:aspartate oxidase